MLSKNELIRKVIHIFTGVIVASLIYFDQLSGLAVFFIVIIGTLTSLICKRVRLPMVSYLLDHLERDDLRKTFPGKGLIFFFVGVLFVMQLFPKDIALASIMVLTFGDSVSHLIGGQFGQIKNIFNGKSKKLFEGTIAGTIAGFLAASIFVTFPEAFIGSFAAMAAEVVQIELNQRELDDNLIVPLVAGTVMYLLRNYQ